MFPVHVKKILFGLICVWPTQKSDKVKPKQKKRKEKKARMRRVSVQRKGFDL